MVAKSEKEITDSIRKAGEQAVYEVGVRGLHPDVVKLLGRLKYRYSYGENVLQHSIEVAQLAAMMAGEIGANVKVAKTGGLLHDLGKALSHEVEGPHAEIGADVATRHNVAAAVCTCIGEHHDDDMSSVEAFIVLRRRRHQRGPGPAPAETPWRTTSSGWRPWKRSGAPSTAWKSASPYRPGAKSA